MEHQRAERPAPDRLDSGRAASRALGAIRAEWMALELERGTAPFDPDDGVVPFEAMTRYFALLESRLKSAGG